VYSRRRRKYIPVILQGTLGASRTDFWGILEDTKLSLLWNVSKSHSELLVFL
jgi:hypothetical protein